MQMPTLPTRSPRSAATGTRECCSDVACDSGLRNRYFNGKRLTTDSFQVEQRYGLERRRLLNRAIHGWGVAYGYAIPKPENGRLTVGPGLALDRCGRELFQAHGRHLALSDVLLLDGKGHPVSADRDVSIAAAAYERGGHGETSCWLLRAHYAERDEGPVQASEPCGCSHWEADRTCETVHYSIQPVPSGECCAEETCGLDCGCAPGPCCAEEAEAQLVKDPGRVDPKRHSRGGRRCLCDHLSELRFPDCGSLCDIEGPFGTIRVDVAHGVRLASLKLGRDRCGDWEFVEIEACGPRRLVKRNDLLYDLILGCDLTYIDAIGWAEWHRRQEPVPFQEFSAAFGACTPGRRAKELITDRFWVRFSKPVRVSTLRPDCFTMTVLTSEMEGGWREPRRVPVLRIEAGRQPSDPDGHASEARMVVDWDWFADAICSSWRRFRNARSDAEATAWVELEFHGGLVLDCNGQPLAATPHGLTPGSTPIGGPGHTFFSSFPVAAAAEPKPSYTAPDDGGEGVSS